MDSKTNAWHYNNAVRELNDEKQITAADIPTLKENQDLHSWLPEAVEIIEAIEKTGKTAYNADVEKALKDMGIDVGGNSGVVYASQRHVSNLKRITEYRKMWDDGWLSIHDATPDMDGKKALLSGTFTIDLFSGRKSNEPVKLVVKADGRIGYQKPKMRTRFYSVQIDQDLFIKLI